MLKLCNKKRFSACAGESVVLDYLSANAAGFSTVIRKRAVAGFHRASPSITLDNFMQLLLKLGYQKEMIMSTTQIKFFY